MAHPVNSTVALAKNSELSGTSGAVYYGSLAKFSSPNDQLVLILHFPRAAHLSGSIKALYVRIIFVMSRLSHLILVALGVWAANASAVLDLTPSNFDDIVLKSGKPTLVEFFAPWCGHCKNLAPIYEELATSLEYAKDKVSIAKVDADAEKELGKRFGVQGFPTLKWFDGRSDTPEDYSAGRDLEDLQEFVVAKTGIKLRKKAKQASQVQMLTDRTFQSEIGSDKDVLVAFTAPWCGRTYPFFIPPYVPRS